MEILGHSEIALIMNTYGHVVPELSTGDSGAVMEPTLAGLVFSWLLSSLRGLTGRFPAGLSHQRRLGYYMNC
jgi:hypothetical protein